MAGRSVVVRRAGDADAALLEHFPDDDRPPLPSLRHLLRNPGVEVHLALAPGADGEDAVGVVVTRHGEVVLPVPAPVLHVELLWVVPSWRRRGVARHLLTAVLAVADAAGAEEVTAVAAPGEREAQRFLARLGFARPAVHRAAPVPVLRARLVPVAAAGGHRRRAALEQLLARRRRQLERPLSAAERPAAGT